VYYNGVLFVYSDSALFMYYDGILFVHHDSVLSVYYEGPICVPCCALSIYCNCVLLTAVTNSVRGTH